MARNKREQYASLECSKNIILVRIMQTQTTDRLLSISFSNRFHVVSKNSRSSATQHKCVNVVCYVYSS